VESRNTLSLLKDNVQDMITQLNDSIWALNKKSVLLTAISDRFKVFIQKLKYAYPDISISLNEEIENDRLLSSFQALHLFRIMQEALNNALRHSKCQHVIIKILSDEKILQISIVDDGIGMYAVNFNGNGINNLKTRAKESGWNAEWVNNKDAGTSVIISSLPIDATVK
jgi:signal transduction histidine kinase